MESSGVNGFKLNDRSLLFGFATVLIHRLVCLLVPVVISVFFVGQTVLLQAEEGEPQCQTFVVESWKYDRTDNRVFTDQYRAGGPIIIAGGTFAEYDIPFPVAGTYRMNVDRAMAEVRPVTVEFKGKKIGRFCEAGTTSWNSIDEIRDREISFVVAEPGLHTITVRGDGLFPHISRLIFVAEEPIPDDWKLNRPDANSLAVSVRANTPNPEAIERGIRYLSENFGNDYPNGELFLQQLAVLATARPVILERLSQEGISDAAERENKRELEENDTALEALRRQALFAENPLIDFDNLLLIRRNNKGSNWGLPMNWESNSSLPKNGYDDEIMILDMQHPESELKSLYKPPRDTLISDMDLDFDAGRLMFSAVGDGDNWQIFEAVLSQNASGDYSSKVESILGQGKDFNFYDSCYLPDGRIIATSTAPMVGVPCVYGASHVANNFLYDRWAGTLRQLCFDQEHNWCPTVLPNGRVLYQRWEYADTPHSNTRLLFAMNPDGTNQNEFYGSNSYWPNSMFYARPIPDSVTKVVTVVGGHHDNPRMGELLVLDPALGRQEDEGAVCRIPGWGKKVEAVVADGLTRNSWPKFLHPFPLCEDFFLVTARTGWDENFGIYLVDTFDNMILIKSLPDNSLMEPTPLRETPRPPVIADRVDLTQSDGTVFMSNIYLGPGLKEIPAPVVKSLRVFTYHFGYHVNGGLLGTIGADGPWDIRAVLGTVPVNEDGSAFFRVPANLPIAIQPLDETGQALALMRSWMTAMPGETLQCNGCHEPQNTAPPISPASTAFSQAPDEIDPYEPTVRGFAFAREIQPILDRYCVSCHDGTASVEINGTPEKEVISLRGDQLITDWSSQIGGSIWLPGVGGRWTVGYDNLARYVRRNGIEGDYHILHPMEFSANTTELCQILQLGHYGVELDPESWNKLIIWIDMNAPFHGSWSDITGPDPLGNQALRRVELLEQYGGLAFDYESKSLKKDEQDETTAQGWTPKEATTASAITQNAQQLVAEAVRQSQEASKNRFDRSLALQQEEWGHAVVFKTDEKGTDTVTKSITLPNGEVLEFVLIPAEKPFWMGTKEITNKQFRAFEPTHSGGRESLHGYQFGQRGYDVDGDNLPAVRVNWNKANDYCRRLAALIGESVSLPTESQWEFAARGGTDTPFWFGDFNTDFAPYANMGDIRLKELAVCSTAGFYTQIDILENPNRYDDWVPKEERFDDGHLLQTQPGSYRSNPFGLFDVHGNVAEWTQTNATPNDSSPFAAKVIKGGSWYDRPYRCSWNFQRSYPAYQGAFDVGFRLIIEAKNSDNR